MTAKNLIIFLVIFLSSVTIVAWFFRYSVTSAGINSGYLQDRWKGTIYFVVIGSKREVTTIELKPKPSEPKPKYETEESVMGR